MALPSTHFAPYRHELEHEMNAPLTGHSRREFLMAAGTASALMALPPGAAYGQQRARTLNVVCHPEPAVVMLGLSQQAPTQLVGGKIYEGLLNYDFDLNPLPSLAKSWKVSPDGLTYEFKLQENAVWHDGKPFTSADVIFTTRDYLPKVHSRARNNFSNVEEWLAPDKHTVVFKMKRVFAPFLGAFQVGSAPMVPKHIYENTDFRANPANAAPVGTGPFKFKEWVRGSHIQLVRNEAYWAAGLPKIDEIIFKIIPDVAARTMALESGAVDIATSFDLELFDIPRLQSNKNLVRVDKGGEFFGRMGWLEINHRVKPLDDKRFRQALMYAIDREFIVKRIWFGVGKPAVGPFTSATKFHNAKARKYNLDLKKAEALLDEMGLKRGAGGKRVTLKLLQSPYGGPWARLAEYIKQALGRVGIEIVMESTDAGAFAQRVSNWDFELTFNILLQFGDPALGVSRSYVSSNIQKGIMFSNTMGYQNKRVDELFAEGSATVDEAARKKAYDEVQDILLDEVPVVWLIEMLEPTFHNRRVKDVITGSIGTYDSFNRVRLDT